MRAAGRDAAAAAMVALLAEQPGHAMSRERIREVLNLTAFQYGQVVAVARLQRYVTVAGGVVTLTGTAIEATDAGREKLSRAQRRRLARAR